MKPEAQLYVMHDDQGRTIAFPNLEDAHWCLGLELDGRQLETRPFGWLREKNPKTLVYLHRQYYWAQDLD